MNKKQGSIRIPPLTKDTQGSKKETINSRQTTKVKKKMKRRIKKKIKEIAKKTLNSKTDHTETQREVQTGKKER